MVKHKFTSSLLVVSNVFNALHELRFLIFPDLNAQRRENKC